MYGHGMLTGVLCISFLWLFVTNNHKHNDFNTFKYIFIFVALFILFNLKAEADSFCTQWFISEMLEVWPGGSHRARNTVCDSDTKRRSSISWHITCFTQMSIHKKVEVETELGLTPRYRYRVLGVKCPFLTECSGIPAPRCWQSCPAYMGL